MNSGLPSVLATICFITSAGNLRPAVTCVDDGLDVLAFETTERHHADLLKTCPRRLELRSEGEQPEHRKLTHALDQQIEQLERCGIRPMRIFE